MSKVYQFDGNSHFDIRQQTTKLLKETAEDLDLKSDIEYFSNSLVDLVDGSQSGKLHKRGYVMLVNGSWGTGKTTATWMLVNQVEKLLKKRQSSLIKLDRSLLPFGSTTESITSFLNLLAQQLLDEGVLDIRSEIRQFILEVSPETSKYDLSASIGPINLSKSVVKPAKSVVDDLLYEKFNRLARYRKAVLIVLDDLDRLRPSEVIDIMRMVEKLRMLPNTFVILPVYKGVIIDACKEDLFLDAPQAAAYIRKLTDCEMYVKSNYSRLKNAFIDSLGSNSVGDGLFGLARGELCWYMLTHLIVLMEAVAFLRDGNDQANIGMLFDGTKSMYIRRFRERLYESVAKDSPTPYPTHAIDSGSENREMFWSLGNYYQDIRDNSDANRTLERLSSLVNFDDINKAITTEPTIVASVGAHQVTPFDSSAEARSSSPLFVEVLLPLLKEISETGEPFVVDNYKLRDIEILSRMIRSDRNFKSSNDPFRTLYEIVKLHFTRYRF